MGINEARPVHDMGRQINEGSFNRGAEGPQPPISRVVPSGVEHSRGEQRDAEVLVWQPPQLGGVGETGTGVAVVEHIKSVQRPVAHNDSAHGGVHETSWETVEALIKTGRIPGMTAGVREGYAPGDIFFYPTPQLSETARALGGDSVVERVIDPPVEGSGTNAGRIAKDHCLMKALGFSLDDPDAKEAAFAVDSDGDTSFFTDQGIPQEVIDRAVLEAESRRGFRLGFSPAIQDHAITLGDPNNGDLRLPTGTEGLPYHLISGIEPLGPIEERLLADLLNKTDEPDRNEIPK